MKLYSSDKCQPCGLVKDFLRRNKIPFVTVEIEEHPELIGKLEMVPTLVLENGTKLVGSREIMRFFTNYDE